MLFAGVFLLLYPTFSDYWNSIHQSRAITGYQQEVDNLDAEYVSEFDREFEKYLKGENK